MDNIRPTPTTRNWLEVSVDTPAGLLTAVQNGADRIVLCTAVSEGGLTPSMGLMRLAASLPNRGFDVPVRAMIRPPAGNFTYAFEDLEVMRHDIDAVAACGLEGVVLGSNLVSGVLDEAAIGGLARHAQALGLCVALHRGFDLTPDTLTALDYAIDQGIDTILTSGGHRSAVNGIAGLRVIVERAIGRIEILAGSGVTAQNASAILASRVTALHASYRSALPDRHDQIAELGYVTCGHRDTDGASVAHPSKHLRLLEPSHVVR